MLFFAHVAHLYNMTVAVACATCSTVHYFPLLQLFKLSVYSACPSHCFMALVGARAASLRQALVISLLLLLLACLAEELGDGRLLVVCCCLDMPLLV